MAAFGTTSSATATYAYLDKEVRKHFPGHNIHWAYSSRMIKDLTRKNKAAPEHPYQLLRTPKEKGRITMKTSPEGIGMLSGVSDILCEHIHEALDIIPE